MEQVKKTSVEWLADKIKWNWQDIEFGEISMSTLVQQAKAMEKEQIIKAFNEGTFFEMEKIDAEQYYNETYRK